MSNNNKKQRRQQQQRLRTNGRRIFTKGRIAPALVTPVAGESILKLHFCREPLSRDPLRTILHPLLLGRLLLTESNAFQCGNNPPKLLLPLREDPGRHLIPGSLGPPESTTQPTSRSVFSVFAGFIVEPNRQTHTERQTTLCTCSNRPHRCTLFMRCGLIIAQKVPNYNTN